MKKIQKIKQNIEYRIHQVEFSEDVILDPRKWLLVVL